MVQFEGPVPADLFARVCMAFEDHAPGTQMELLPSSIGPRARFHLPEPPTQQETEPNEEDEDGRR